jgi:hypothetical protein
MVYGMSFCFSVLLGEKKHNCKGAETLCLFTDELKQANQEQSVKAMGEFSSKAKIDIE